MKNVINPKSPQEFRKWLIDNHQTEQECYIPLIKKEPKEDGKLYYIDAVYEALCFGWIDNTQAVIDGQRFVRISKRVKNSSWNELNKERARYLIRQGKMQQAGFDALPNLNDEFVIPGNIKEILIENGALERFIGYPLLYQKIRINYITSFKKKDDYQKAFDHLVEMTLKNKLYGQWNDYGRLK